MNLLKNENQQTTKRHAKLPSMQRTNQDIFICFRGEALQMQYLWWPVLDERKPEGPLPAPQGRVPRRRNEPKPRTRASGQNAESVSCLSVSYRGAESVYGADGRVYGIARFDEWSYVSIAASCPEVALWSSAYSN